MTAAGSTTRRGSVYLAVLGTVAMVTIVAASALLAIRIERRSVVTDDNTAEARLYARAGIEMGMRRIAADPAWRRTLGSGDWYTQQPIGKGSFTLNVTDPSDGNINDSNDDPTLLTATGECRGSRFILKATVTHEAEPSPLQVSVHGGGEVEANGGTLDSDQIVAGNSHVIVSSGGTIAPVLMIDNAPLVTFVHINVEVPSLRDVLRNSSNGYVTIPLDQLNAWYDTAP